MRIEVIGDDESTSAQARTYAEYRVFTTLTRHAWRVRGARVVLRRDQRKGMRDGVVCEVTVALEPSGSARTRASAPHAYAAINRVVERVDNLMRRRTAERRPS